MDQEPTDREPPAQEAPWAMQLVARVEKIDPPAVADICAAAVLATIGVVADDKAAPGGSWAEPIHAWSGGGRIRKLVRRARGAAWQRALEPMGVTATSGRAEVRAYVPCQMDRVPGAIAALQIRSSELAPAEQIELDPFADVTDAEASDATSTMVIALSPQFDMSWGKQAAQSAHAGQILWRSASVEQRQLWIGLNRPVRILYPTSDSWPAALAGAEVSVNDGGYTEVPPGSLTAVAWWGRPDDAGTQPMVP